MATDRSPMILNILLVGVLAFAIYLGLLYLENQQKVSPVLPFPKLEGSVVPPPVRKIEDPGLPKVPPPAPSAPLFIRDDIQKFLNSSPTIKAAFKGYRTFGLLVGEDSYTVRLDSEGGLDVVTKGLGDGLDFTLKADADAFRKLTILAARNNHLGVMQRLGEMRFDPPESQKQLIDRINAAQGFTSKVRSGD